MHQIDKTIGVRGAIVTTIMTKTASDMGNIKLALGCDSRKGSVYCLTYMSRTKHVLSIGRPVASHMMRSLG